MVARRVSISVRGVRAYGVQVQLFVARVSRGATQSTDFLPRLGIQDLIPLQYRSRNMYEQHIAERSLHT